ncbi:MAG: flagellar basal body P-ring formation protein FlgA [Deltaproteobacteria bacterium]|nr:flagellar basal body P-ring formation protein FlgA [Deltaproteobacteria bacterium]
MNRALVLISALIASLAFPAFGMVANNVSLKKTAMVSHEVVYLCDVAEIHGPHADELAQISILKMPPSTIDIPLSADYIAGKIREKSGDSVFFSGAQEVTVSQRVIKFERDELESLYKNAVLENSPWRGRADIIIEDIQMLQNITVFERNKNQIQAKFSPREDFVGLVRLSLTFGTGPSAQNFVISGRVRVVTKVPVVQSPIHRGDLITSATVKMERLDITTYTQTTMNLDECVGMRATTTIRAGRPVLKSNIELPPVITRGEEVIIEASNSRLIIKDRGIALKDGNIAQKIPVRNMRSGRQIFGTVIAPSRVQVMF